MVKELEKFKIERPSIPKGKGVLGSAIDLCGVDKSNSNLAEALIGNLLVVNDVNEIKRKLKARVNDKFEGPYIKHNEKLYSVKLKL